MIKTQSDQLLCILCRQKLSSHEGREPYTQICQHSICGSCVRRSEQNSCPIDGKAIEVTKSKLNIPLLVYLGAAYINDTNQSNIYQNELIKLANFLKDNSQGSLSPQLYRRLLGLILSTPAYDDGSFDYSRKICSVFYRFLVELIQAHYNTKQREQDTKRLIRDKGCSIDYPELTDAIIEELIGLYQVKDTSYERKVLIMFLQQKISKRQELCKFVQNDMSAKPFEKILQTLYKSSCFHIVHVPGSSSRFRLKEDLCSPIELRQQHDIEMIKLAQDNHIRLSAESWAFLLYRSSNPGAKSRIQYLLDKNQSTPTVSELELTVRTIGDIYGVQTHLNGMLEIETLIEKISKKETLGITEMSEEILGILAHLSTLTPLFATRQRRKTALNHDNKIYSKI